MCRVFHVAFMSWSWFFYSFRFLSSTDFIIHGLDYINQSLRSRWQTKAFVLRSTPMYHTYKVKSSMTISYFLANRLNIYEDKLLPALGIKSGCFALWTVVPSTGLSSQARYPDKVWLGNPVNRMLTCKTRNQVSIPALFCWISKLVKKPG